MSASSIRPRKWLILAVAVIALPLAALWLRFGTFTARTVVAGEVYRSAQPGADDLRSAVERLGIKSVINLRGANDAEAWYREEVAAATELGLEHRDFHFPNILSDWPQRPITHELVRYLEQAPKPVLIHCMAGADRAGWAAAMAGALAGKPLPQVRRELSPTRGHVCSSPCRFHDFIDQYADWLQTANRPHEADAFREWVFNHYSPGPYRADVELIGRPRQSFMVAERFVRYRVRVTNRSTATWSLSRETPPGMRLGARMLGPLAQLPADLAGAFRARSLPEIDLMRLAPPLPRVVEPGQHWETNIEFVLPGDSGKYLLQFDMVDEEIHWFSDLGETGLILPVEVAPAGALPAAAATAHAQK